MPDLTNKKLAYLAYFAIFLEVAFLTYFSVTTQNIAQYSVSLALIIMTTFPLGFSVAILLFRGKTLSELLMIGLGTGLPLTAGIWGMLTYSRVPIHPATYLGVTFFITIILFLVVKLKYKRILSQTNVKYEEIYLPIIVFLIGFLWHALMQANNNVSYDCDPQSTVYIETLMKYQGYPAIKPFLSGEVVNITHPPTFHILVVLASIIKNSTLNKECMAITVICGAYFVLAIYLLSYYLSKKNLIIAFFAGVLTLNRAYLTTYNDGNTSELFAFACVTIFLMFLLHAFEEDNWIKSFVTASVAGFVFSHAALSQTEVFQWYLISMGFFIVTFVAAKHNSCRKDYLVIVVSMFICGMCVLPWFLPSLSNFSKESLGKLEDKEATELFLSLVYWHSYTILVLSMIGLVLLCIERDKIGIFIVTHILAMFFLIIHWRFFKLMGFEWFQLKPFEGTRFGARAYFTSPLKFLWSYTIAWYSLTIAFPIASSYCLNLFNNLMNKIKIFKYKLVNIPLLFIAIGVSFFMYYEYKGYFRYPEWLLKSDYETLLWFRKNTSYKDTLVLNPPEPIKLPNGMQVFCSYWVPAISERRAINARGLGGGPHIPIPNDMQEEINNLGDAFYNIQSQNVYGLLKKNGVSHIFVSALLSGQVLERYLKAPFLELVHYKTVTDQGTAFIFKVK